MPQSVDLARLRGHISKLGKKRGPLSDAEKALVGSGGEYLTEALLDDVNFSWIGIGQCRHRYSTSLLHTQDGKRPDYLVNDGTFSFLLDAKHLSLASAPAGGSAVRLDQAELDAMQVTARAFGLPVFFIVWSRLDDDLRYTLLEPGDFHAVAGQDYSEAMVAAGGFTVW